MRQSHSTQIQSVTIDPEMMSGAPVFTGTRVPIQTLFDYLMDGCSLSEFLDNFPSVSQEAALKVLAYESPASFARWLQRRQFSQPAHAD